LLCIAIVFAGVNSQDVEVDWIITTTNTPLIIVIIASVLVGMIVDRLLQYQRRRRSR
jgi:uncharacterized integral membrane protein